MLFLVFIFIFSATTVLAKTYYVSPLGSDTMRGDSFNKRKAINQMIRRMLPGDTLVLKDGIYNEKIIISVSGTKTNPIIIKAQHDGKVIIDGESRIYPLLRIKGKRYIGEHYQFVKKK